jgi:hypothetical protein
MHILYESIKLAVDSLSLATASQPYQSKHHPNLDIHFKSK